MSGCKQSDFDFYIVVKDGTKDFADVTPKAYRSIRRIKRRPVDIFVGTESRFSDRKDMPTVENEVFRKRCSCMDSAAKEWLDFAKADLGVARHLLETYRL